jgi:hypothetical protein
MTKENQAAMTISDINEKFATLCMMLENESLNYAADFILYSCPGFAGKSLTEILPAALGHPVVIGGSRSATAQELLKDFREGVEYSGDYGSHPNLAFLASEQFKAVVSELLGWFEEFTAEANQIIGFWLKQGHPFYPVFWDFAYVIEKGQDAFVFIGSSSD